MRVWLMRKGVEVRLGPGDRERLQAVIGSRNKPTIWRWQARFMAEGVRTA
jgi:hypothetical protein